MSALFRGMAQMFLRECNVRRMDLSCTDMLEKTKGVIESPEDIVVVNAASQMCDQPICGNTLPDQQRLFTTHPVTHYLVHC
jgi:hypothetical protein